MPIDTEKFSSHLRKKGIDIDKKAILVTNFKDSVQEKDLTEPANCNGFGRIRHFKYSNDSEWGINPLPLLPAAKALGFPHKNEVRAQVFQNSVCNWRCWYCFVDYKLLAGDKRYAEFLTCEEMLNYYLKQDAPPLVIDLSGGQPDLTPEWVPWMMEALIERGLSDKVFLWSDDNLSNDYFWQFLSDDSIELVSKYSMYSRVCCFKGIDEESFALNTEASPSLFNRQFDLFKRLIDLGIDLYCYVTMTSKVETDFHSVVPKFMDRLQKIREKLPLRVVPLKIYEFSPVKTRMKEVHNSMLQGQIFANQIWKEELAKRFSVEELSAPITEVTL